MYNLTPLGEQRADSTDSPHNAEEAIPVIMKEHGTLESDEIATYLNMEAAKAESILRRLEKRGLVTNLNPSEHHMFHAPRVVMEQESTKAKVATGAVSVMKKLGNLAIDAVKYINKDPKVVGRAVIGNSAVVFGSQKRKQLGRDRDAVLRGRRH